MLGTALMFAAALTSYLASAIKLQRKKEKKERKKETQSEQSLPPSLRRAHNFPMTHVFLSRDGDSKLLNCTVGFLDLEQRAQIWAAWHEEKNPRRRRSKGLFGGSPVQGQGGGDERPGSQPASGKIILCFVQEKRKAPRNAGPGQS